MRSPSGVVVESIEILAYSDEGYDADADAFLVGSFEFEALAPGSVTLNSSVGGAGILDQSAGSLSPVLGTANINVVPEPGLGLLASFSASLLLLRRRRRSL